MQNFGYLVYLLRINKPHRPRDLYRLSDAGDGHVDLLDTYEDILKGFGDSYYSDPKAPEGYRIKKCVRSGRTIQLTINKGPAGGSGEVWHIDEKSSLLETGERQALLSALRAQLVVPENSFYGLLFVERIGVRHLKQIIDSTVLQPAGRNAKMTTRVESFAESSDWKSALTGKQALLVSELLAVRSSGGDASTLDEREVRIEVGRGLLGTVNEKLKDLIVGRQEKRESKLDLDTAYAAQIRNQTASPDAFTVLDATSLEEPQVFIEAQSGDDDSQELAGTLADTIPVSTSGLTHKSWEVGVGERQVERKFVIERDAVPQFVYETSGRLTDRVLLETWNQHAVTILGHRGVTVPNGWNETP